MTHHTTENTQSTTDLCNKKWSTQCWLNHHWNSVVFQDNHHYPQRVKFILQRAVFGGLMPICEGSGGCFTNVSRALQNILSKFVCCRNRTSYEHFKLKLCSCAQSDALGTRTKFQLEILTINVITGIVYFRETILESSRNVSETTPWPWVSSSSYPSQRSHSSTDAHGAKVAVVQPVPPKSAPPVVVSIKYGLLLSYVDGLVQERCNSIANELELHHSCTNPLMLCSIQVNVYFTFKLRDII